MGLSNITPSSTAPSHDDRQRDATAVDHHRRLLPFFPRSVGLCPTLSLTIGAFIMALSMFLPTPCDTFHLVVLGKTQTLQILKHACLFRFGKTAVHCACALSALPVAPSTGSPCAIHERLRHRRVEDPWVCDPRQSCGCSFDSPGADAAESVSAHVAKTRRSHPKIGSLLSQLQTRYSRMEPNYPLFTDKFLVGCVRSSLPQRRVHWLVGAGAAVGVVVQRYRLACDVIWARNRVGVAVK